MPTLEPSGVISLGPVPATLNGLLAWWGPASQAGVADGTAISATNKLIDLSGNGRDATPYTSVKPVWHTNVQNGNGAVLFAGTTDVLQFATTHALTDWTVVLVCGGLNGAANVINYAIGQTGAGMAVGGSSGTYGWLAEIQDGGNYRATAIKPTAWGIDLWTPEAIYRDGGLIASTLTGAVTRFDLTDLGGRNDAANLGLSGYCGEVLIYDRTLASGDRSALQEYLRARWGTP